MPLQQISVSPLEKTWGKECSNGSNRHEWKLQETVFSSRGPNPPERCLSQESSLSNGHDICRICHCEGDSEVPLIAPCYCSGSLRYVHQACLQQWIKSSDIRNCELCKFQFVMHSKIKPFNEWETLEMSGVERRKILCSVTFHAVALTCVVWSLYVLIDRTAEEIQRGQLEWPFWTKLIVVAIGFTGGVVFMYIQCKAYVLLCHRWRAFNRVIFVQNAPEKVALPNTRRQTLGVQDENTIPGVCCGTLTGQNCSNLRKGMKGGVPVCSFSVRESSLKENKMLTNSAYEGERVRGSDYEESLNNMVEENQNSYLSFVTKNIHVKVVGKKQSNSIDKIDLRDELSQLLHSEDKGRLRSSSDFLVLPTRVLTPSSSEESFPSPSVCLLQPSSANIV